MRPLNFLSQQLKMEKRLCVLSLWIYSRLGSSAYVHALYKYFTGQDKIENVTFYVMKFRTI
jgi:hypothetical protein